MYVRRPNHWAHMITNEDVIRLIRLIHQIRLITISFFFQFAFLIHFKINNNMRRASLFFFFFFQYLLISLPITNLPIDFTCLIVNS